MFRELLQKVLSSRRKPGFPLVRYDMREIPPDYTGPIITSDIDKTYLDTRFHSLRDLVHTAVEPAEAKRGLPGMAALLRGFQQGPDAIDSQPLYFISASPPMMREVLLEKMEIDGILPDGLTSKTPCASCANGAGTTSAIISFTNSPPCYSIARHGPHPQRSTRS